MALLELGHPAFVSDAVDIQGRAQVRLAVSAAAAATAVLPEGIYDLWTEGTAGDTWIKVAPVANDVTATTGYLLRAANTISFLVRKDCQVGAIATGSGTLVLHMIG